MQGEKSDSLRSGQSYNNCRRGVKYESQGALTEETSSDQTGAEVLLLEVWCLVFERSMVQMLSEYGRTSPDIFSIATASEAHGNCSIYIMGSIII